MYWCLGSGFGINRSGYDYCLISGSSQHNTIGKALHSIIGSQECIIGRQYGSALHIG